MWVQGKPETVGSAELLGDFHPLVDQLGSAEGLVSLDMATDWLQTARVWNLASLRRFLESYSRRLLIAHELPAICAAYRHASSSWRD